MLKPAALLTVVRRTYPWSSWVIRPSVGTEWLVLLATGFMLATGNTPFWRAALAGRPLDAPASWGFAAGLLVIFMSAYCVFALLFATRLTVKPLLTLLLVLTALASWYMARYSIYLDRAMLRNVLATDMREAGELLSWTLLSHVLLVGLLPAALVWWPRIERPAFGRAVRRRMLWIAACLCAGALALWLVFADFASLMRNHSEVRYLVTPGNAVTSLIAEAWGHAKRPGQPKIAVGTDARLGAAWLSRVKPVLFVLVVGETARAQNFSLNGYARPTNPQLERRDVISFSHASACGTSTAISLPCMFSPFGRARYDEAKIQSHESLLHVLDHAGFNVLWRDNQSGCKGVCDGLKTEQLDQARIDSLCAEGQCFDEVLLSGMDGVARDSKGNLFVVMHQLGSHGPAYFKRYPAAFRKFTPACENEELRQCTPAEIVNAYDNSLLYTDFFLAAVIDFLDRSQDRYDTAMLYVSDHGESLGDSGLYLHGMPYSIAPDVQIRVPFVAWLSPAFRKSFAVDQTCLTMRSAMPISHDNLFHSLLGVLDVDTVVYQRAMDLFAPCRPVPAPSAALSPVKIAP